MIYNIQICKKNFSLDTNPLRCCSFCFDFWLMKYYFLTGSSWMYCTCVYLFMPNVFRVGNEVSLNNSLNFLKSIYKCRPVLNRLWCMRKSKNFKFMSVCLQYKMPLSRKRKAVDDLERSSIKAPRKYWVSHLMCKVIKIFDMWTHRGF